MKIPPEITYRFIDKTDAIDSLVHEKIGKLEQVCDHISSCHIAIEKINDRPRSGSPYRVRLDITVPPGHEIVAESNPGEGNQYDPLDAVIRNAFRAAQTQLKKLNQRQNESGKSQTHEGHETTALVVRLFRDQGYGFIRGLDGQEFYFHRNSVLHDDFDRLEVGTGVRFVSDFNDGEQGPHASTVQIVDKPGHRAGEAEETLIEPPLGWQ
ncbi:HPF/RaiA family ribosome-associated protein [Leptolyngbya sp. FACHB-261]|uniref:HPF/RaiA family ribosome-associated protein n=1 Tax=Leptolyngbya sp. FACHB-261 TaxID=2692806 RepID=UPI00168668A8|nr:HPF/RaiA family ribosome-associated protein [Leptolyngbya sp. FACHB-261]MBD2104978.1 HPF/RaiA family ribosome-associated protein [Leptolyngbya sp. FACHB-261]